MSIRAAQSKFLKDFAKLITWAFEQGYELTAGELLRTVEQHRIYQQTGKTKATTSLHCNKLAGDLNLFINGVYITDTAKYAPLGKYWCSLDAKNRWGGDWDKDGSFSDERFSDGDHFERQL